RVVLVANLNNENASFHSGPGQMALFGAVLPSEKDLSITGLTLPAGKYEAIAAGDWKSKELLLSVTDKADAVLGKSKPEAPQVKFETKESTKANLKVTNVKSEGPSLYMFTLLTVLKP